MTDPQHAGADGGPTQEPPLDAGEAVPEGTDVLGPPAGDGPDDESATAAPVPLDVPPAPPQPGQTLEEGEG